jgi:hypothetical protein
VRWSFLSQFWPLLKQAQFFEAAGAVAKINSSLKFNHRKQIYLAQISETRHSMSFVPFVNPYLISTRYGRSMQQRLEQAG